MKYADINHEDLKDYKIPYYLEVDKWDVIDRLKSLFENGTLFLREDGKIDHKRVPLWHPPWAFVQHMGKDCFLFHKIYFKFWKRIHSECQKCWKVVVAPKNLEELFELYHVQRRLNYPGKCGVETFRDNSPKNYGGYFYCNSLEEGQKRYKEVKGLLPDMPMVLKRACTEYEQEMGDSKDWMVTAEQEEEEWILRDSFVSNVIDYSQARHLIAHLHKFWIHTAFQHGDDSYLKYTEGNKLFPDLRTYQNG